MGASLLKKTSLFEQLNDKQIEEIAKLGPLRDVMVGEELFIEGEEAKSFFVVETGTIEISRKGEKESNTVSRLSAGMFFGEMALFDPAPRAGTARVAENGRVFEFNYEKVTSWLEKNPEIALGFYRGALKTLCRRIRHTTQDLSSLKELKLRHA